MTTPNQPDQGQEFTRWVKLDDVIPADANPRDHDIPHIQALIRRYGFLVPIVRDDRTGKLIMGHGRLLALRGMRDDGEAAPRNVQETEDDWAVPEVGMESRDDGDARALQVGDNRVNELAQWRNDELFEWLSEFAAEAPDLLELAAYNSDDLDRMLAETTVIEPLPPTPPPLPPPAPYDSGGGDWLDRDRDDTRDRDDDPPSSTAPLAVQPAWGLIQPIRAVFHTGGIRGAEKVRAFVGGQPIIETGGTVIFPTLGLRVPEGCWVVRRSKQLELLTHNEFIDELTPLNEPARRVQRDASEAPVPLAKPEDLSRDEPDDGPERLGSILERAWRPAGSVTFSDEPDDTPEEDGPPY